MKQISIEPRFFIALGILIGCYIAAFLLPGLLVFCFVGLAVLLVAAFLDVLLLFNAKEGLQASRSMAGRFSNGDPNPVYIDLNSRYKFPLTLRVMDEVPVQFQWRNMKFDMRLDAGGSHRITYSLRPVKRGEYEFGKLIVLTTSPIGFISRIYAFPDAQTVAVYPSYLQLKKYQLLAISNRLTEVGVKSIRRLGHSTEFEQIKEYVRGDDYRTINWKATARSNKLMVNQYMDERSQQIFCLVDKSRAMQMPFEGMTLLDYSINASLILANIAMNRHDKSGLITFSKQIDQFLPAGKDPRHMRNLQEVLYRQETEFQEADYERLYAFVSRRISHRSLLVLFTNFESQTAMRRQLPYLQRLSKQHLLLVVFFENTELSELLDSRPMTTEDIYIKAVGEQFALDKKLIVKELERHGIQAILTPPAELTVNAINRYLEIKARSMI